MGEKIGPNQTDRANQGSERHLAVDAGYAPLAVRHTRRLISMAKMLEEIVEAIAPIR